MRIEAVAALGRLEPAGDLRLVAAPITGIGGTPRITELLFNEGNRVRTGQLLAKFDNGPGHRAEQKLVRTARITNLSRRLELQQLGPARYRKLASVESFSASNLDTTEQRTLELQGHLHEAEMRVRLDSFEARHVRDISGLRVIARLGR